MKAPNIDVSLVKITLSKNTPTDILTFFDDNNCLVWLPFINESNTKEIDLALTKAIHINDEINVPFLITPETNIYG